MTADSGRRIARAVAGIAIITCVGCGAQARKDRHLARAEAYFQRQKFPEAVVEYSNVLRVDHTNSLAIRQLGRAYYALGDGRRAFWFLQRAAETDPSDEDVAFKLGTIYLRGRKTAEARRTALDLLSRGSTNANVLALLVDASAGTNELRDAQQTLLQQRARYESQPLYHVALGNLYLRLNDLAGAEAVFKQGFARSPDSSDLHLAMAALHRARRDHEAAEAEYRKAAAGVPMASPARLRWAAFKAERGQAEEARAMLEEVLKAAPKYSPARLQLADLLFRTRKFAECRTALRPLLDDDPSEVDARVLNGKALVALGKSAEGLAEFDKLVEQFPKAGAIRFERAVARLQARDVRGGMSELAECLALEPQRIDAALMLAELNIRTGNSGPAVAALEDLVRRYPNYPRVLVLLGTAYRGQDRKEQAVAVFRRLVELTPDAPQSYYLLGRTLRQCGRADEAVQAYEKAIELDPRVIPPLAELAGMEMAAKNAAAAVERIRKQIEKVPDSAAHHFLLGRLYMVQEDADKAEAALLKAVELQPESAPPYMALGRLYAATGRDQQALQRLEQVLGKDPKSIGSMMLCGTLYQRRNEVEKARAVYERLLALNPRMPAALNNLAYLYLEQVGDVEKAFDLAQRAREAAPEDPYVADTLGWILYRKGDPRWALSLLQEAAEQMAKEPEVLYHLGMASAALGNEDAAAAVLERALADKKPFKGSEEAAAALALIRLPIGGSTDAEALRTIDAVLAKDPSNAAALVRKAAAREAAGDKEEAKANYAKAVEANPLYVPGILGLARLRAEQPAEGKEALALARKARDIQPQNPQTVVTVAAIALKVGEFRWAASLLEEAVRAFPESPAMQYNLGVASCLVGRQERAKECLKRALDPAVFPQADQARLCLRMIEIYEKPDADAKRDVEEALAKSPDYLPALLASARLKRIEGEGKAAAEVLRKATASYPDFAPGLIELAELLNETGDPDAAYPLAVRAKDLLPGDARVAALTGKLAFVRKDYAWAARLLQEASASYPQDDELFYSLGLSQYHLGQKSAAEKNLQKALALKADSARASEARKALQELQKDRG